MGASLWLLPPPGSKIQAALTSLIQKNLPIHFAPESVPSFIPHMTITSEIPQDADPQDIISKISVEELPEVVFKAIDVGETFFTRVTLHLNKNSPIKNLAKQCREKFAFGGQSREDAEKWAEEVFTPHVSLVYSSAEPALVNSLLMPEIEKRVSESGVVVGGSGELNGWKGGKIALVETWRDISEWKLAAEKTL